MIGDRVGDVGLPMEPHLAQVVRRPNAIPMLLAGTTRLNPHYAVPEVRDARPLHHRDRPLQLHRCLLDQAEQRDAGAEEHRHEVDVHLIRQARIEALAADVSAVDPDVLVPGDLPGSGHRVLDTRGDEDDVLVLLRAVVGTPVGDHTVVPSIGRRPPQASVMS